MITRNGFGLSGLYHRAAALGIGLNIDVLPQSGLGILSAKHSAILSEIGI